MQNGGEEKRQGCEEPGAPGCNVATGKRQGSENLMQNGGEEKRQGSENLMQNGGEEKRVCVTPGGPGCNDNLMQNGGEEKRQGSENLMQNGPGGEEERRGNMF